MLIEANLDLTALLERVVEEAAQLAGARYGALGVLGPDRLTLSRFVTYGLTREERLAIGAPPKGLGLLQESLTRGGPLRVTNLTQHPSSVGVPLHHPPMTTFLSAPVMTGDGRLYGNLYLTDRLDGHSFDEDDESLIAAFGRAAGLLIDQAEMREHLRELTLGEERDRLARDLHDTVVQRLFGLGLSLQTTLSLVSDEKVATRLSEAVDELDLTIREIRTTIFEIDRSTKDSLVATVRSLCHEVSSRLGLEVRVTTADGLDAKVDPEIATQVVRALREMLSNVVRHARATSVSVSVSTDEDEVVVDVSDNGVGLSTQTPGGRGLRNLQDRAHELGGQCQIMTPATGGTAVHWTAKRREER